MNILQRIVFNFHLDKKKLDLPFYKSDHVPLASGKKQCTIKQSESFRIATAYILALAVQLQVLLKSFACPLEALLGKTLDSTTISSVAKTLEQELKAKSCTFDELSSIFSWL